MFEKKFWKRGDKLTVKELNRIEEGIDALNDSGNANDNSNADGKVVYFDLYGTLNLETLTQIEDFENNFILDTSRINFTFEDIKNAINSQNFVYLKTYMDVIIDEGTINQCALFPLTIINFYDSQIVSCQFETFQNINGMTKITITITEDHGNIMISTEASSLISEV